MGLWLPKNRKELKKHLSDPLFKNAYFLMFFSLTSAGLGFFFWVIAARFYSTADIGLASAHRYGLDLHALALGFRHLSGKIFSGSRRQKGTNKFLSYYLFKEDLNYV